MAARSSSTPFFFFAAMMLVDLVLVALLYPETAGVSLEDMQHAIADKNRATSLTR